MKKSTLSLKNYAGMRQSMLVTLLACVSAKGEEDGRFNYEYPGYDDTPRLAGSTFRVHQKDRPQPPRVIPSGPAGEAGPLAPSDATVLFSGTTLDQFEETTWEVKAGVLRAANGDLTTKKAYGDCQLHVEWRTPAPPGGAPGNMGNSGVFFMSLYELQIYDSFSSKIYADGSAAAVYGQTPPMVNVCRPPGQWQSFDAVFKAPVFRGGTCEAPALLTVLHNGVLVHNSTKILGPTGHKTASPYQVHAAKLPLKLQGHASPVEFRNIWIRELD